MVSIEQLYKVLLIGADNPKATNESSPKLLCSNFDIEVHLLMEAKNIPKQPTKASQRQDTVILEVKTVQGL